MDGFIFPFNFHNLLVIQNSSSFWLNSKEEKHDFFGPVPVVAVVAVVVVVTVVV